MITDRYAFTNNYLNDIVSSTIRTIFYITSPGTNVPGCDYEHDFD